MAKFAFGVVILVACALLGTEAGHFNNAIWTKINDYAKSQNDVTGQSLIEWFNKDFQGAASGDSELKEFLGLTARFASASRPDDCDDIHFAALMEVQMAAVTLDQISQIFRNKVQEYNRLCQARATIELQEALEKMAPDHVQLVNQMAQKLIAINPTDFHSNAADLDQTSIELLWLLHKNFDGLDRQALAEACRAFIPAVADIYKDLFNFKRIVRLQQVKYDLPEFEAGRFGYLSEVFCINVLSRTH